MARRILLIRHAESEWNAADRIQGWADPPLSPHGRDQAAELGRELAAIGIGGAVSSDLLRARETAAALCAAAGAPAPTVDARWREREIGWWSGLTNREVAERYPEDLAAWRAHQVARPPGGESDESVLRRARAALGAAATAAGAAGGEFLVVVSHGGLISVLERAAAAGPGGFSNLSGRWVELGPGGPALGDRFEFTVEGV